MRGDGVDAGEVARDLEGEVDRALRRGQATGVRRQATEGEQQGRVVSPAALHSANMAQAARARTALSEALDLYSRARALGQVVGAEAEQEVDGDG